MEQALPEAPRASRSDVPEPQRRRLGTLFKRDTAWVTHVGWPAPRQRALRRAVNGAAVLMPLLALAPSALGCATASPLLGRARPAEAPEITTAGTARLDTGDLDRRAERDALTGPAVVPVAAVDIPLGGKRTVLRSGTFETQVAVAGTLGRVGITYHRWLSPGLTRWGLRVGALGGAGYVHQNAEHGWLTRGSIPVLLTLDGGGIYGFWIGPRVGGGRGALHLTPDAAANTKLNARFAAIGGTLGLSQGFGFLEVVIELDAAWEWWRFGNETFGGVAWTPTFALRIRPFTE